MHSFLIKTCYGKKRLREMEKGKGKNGIMGGIKRERSNGERKAEDKRMRE